MARWRVYGGILLVWGCLRSRLGREWQQAFPLQLSQKLRIALLHESDAELFMFVGKSQSVA